MSFFGVTTLGYQNHVKEYLKQPPPTLPPLPRPVPLSMTDAYGPGAKGSYDEHRRIWVKHTRTPLGMRHAYIFSTESRRFILYITNDSFDWV